MRNGTLQKTGIGAKDAKQVLILRIAIAVDL